MGVGWGEKKKEQIANCYPKGPGVFSETKALPSITTPTHTDTHMGSHTCRTWDSIEGFFGRCGTPAFILVPMDYSGYSGLLWAPDTPWRLRPPIRGPTAWWHWSNRTPMAQHGFHLVLQYFLNCAKKTPRRRSVAQSHERPVLQSGEETSLFLFLLVLIHSLFFWWQPTSVFSRGPLLLVSGRDWVKSCITLWHGFSELEPPEAGQLFAGTSGKSETCSSFGEVTRREFLSPRKGMPSCHCHDIRASQPQVYWHLDWVILCCRDCPGLSCAL